MEEGERENVLRTDYAYDNRGNLLREEIEGRLIHGYEYGAMNRLSKSWNDKGQEAAYLYNGLGQRTGKSVNGEEEDYLLDLTRGYHNLLGIQKNESGQRFYFDGNVAAMEATIGKTAGKRTRPVYGAAEDRRTAFSGLHYYMQDELGSPLRVSGYRKKEGSFIGRSEYLTYGYDEFGNDLERELEEEGIPNPYDRQGAEQPFGYTGYRYDGISGTYFAQAREYQTGNGRFTAEDVIKGNGVNPETLNHYDYCLNNPLAYIDYNGQNPVIVVLVVVGATLFLGGCGNQLNEEDMVPVPDATSDHEFENSIDVYNSEDYITRTNCYAYALDVIKNPLTGADLNSRKEHSYEKPWGVQPGMLSGQYSEYNYYYAITGTDYGNSNFIKYVKDDVNAMGLNFEEYNEGMTGGYCVAIAIDKEEDYHFYRENGDGTWSAKSGPVEVETGIENPQAHAYEKGYQIFLGYFYISEREDY